MGKVAAALVLVVFAFGAATSYAPWLTRQGPVLNSTPSLGGITSQAEVKVRAGQQACIKPVPLDPGDRQLQMLLHTRGDRAPLVDISVKAPGYAARGRFKDYPVSGATPVVADLSEAPPRPQDGEVCLHNRGRLALWLVGTSEAESLTLPVTSVDGKEATDIDPAITFLAGERRSILQRPGTILDRAAGFTGVLPAWLLWPLGLLFFFGLPVGAAVALLRADRHSQ